VAFSRPGGDNIKGANLYITNIPKHWSDQDLKNAFLKFGNVIQARLLIDHTTNMSKGVGFVLFDQKSQATCCVIHASSHASSITLIPHASLSHRIVSWKTVVGHVAEKVLYQLFSPYGNVTKVNVIYDSKKGQCKGYGFVTMSSWEEADSAIYSLNGYWYNGRELQVSYHNK
jgi:RNA recognition motif-containing protein